MMIIGTASIGDGSIVDEYVEIPGSDAFFVMSSDGRRILTDGTYAMPVAFNHHIREYEALTDFKMKLSNKLVTKVQEMVSDWLSR